MELLVSKVLKKILGNYLKDTSALGTGNDIKLGSNNKVSLRDVALKEAVIGQMLMLPKAIQLQNATCDEVDVDVPMSILKKPIMIQAKGIRIDAHEDETAQGVIIVIKNTKKKSKRQLMDTILLQMSDFKLSLRIKGMVVNISFDSFYTYFADKNFKEKTFNTYRALEIKGINVTVTKDNDVFYLVRNMEIDGRITQTHETESYQLLDTTFDFNINRLQSITVNSTPVNKKNVNLRIKIFEITVKNDDTNEVLRFVTEMFRGNLVIENQNEKQTFSMRTGVEMVECMYESNGVGKRVMSGFGENIMNIQLNCVINDKVLNAIQLHVNLNGIEISFESAVILKLFDFVNQSIISKLKNHNTTTQIETSNTDQPIKEIEEYKSNDKKITYTSLIDLGKKYIGIIAEKCGLQTSYELFERFEFICDIKDCILSIPFEQGGGCNVHIDDVSLTTTPKFDKIATNKTSHLILHRDIQPISNTKPLKFSLGIGGIHVIHVNEKGERNEVVSPVKAILNCFIGITDELELKQIDLETTINPIQSTLTTDTFLSLSKYFTALATAVNKVVGEQFKQLASNIATQSNSIIDTIINTMNTQILPLLNGTTLPRICLTLNLKGGKFEVPFETLLTTEPKNTTSVFSFKNSSIALCGDSKQRGFAIFFDQLHSGSIENVLTPFKSISTSEIPEGEHSVLVSCCYDVGSLLTKPKSIHFDVSLYGISLILSLNQAPAINAEKIKSTDVNKSKEVVQTIQKRPEVEKVEQWIKQHYNGFQASLALSECAISYDDTLSSINLNSKSFLVQNAKEYTQQLSIELSNVQMAKYELENKVEDLKKQIKNLQK
ncbi:Chorein N-terminal domain-containing protein [Entamoeba marina]